MSVTNNLVFFLNPALFLLTSLYLFDSIFNFADVPEEVRRGDKNLGALFPFPLHNYIQYS